MGLPPARPTGPTGPAGEELVLPGSEWHEQPPEAWKTYWPRRTDSGSWLATGDRDTKRDGSAAARARITAALRAAMGFPAARLPLEPFFFGLAVRVVARAAGVVEGRHLRCSGRHVTSRVRRLKLRAFRGESLGFGDEVVPLGPHFRLGVGEAFRDLLFEGIGDEGRELSDVLRMDGEMGGVVGHLELQDVRHRSHARPLTRHESLAVLQDGFVRILLLTAGGSERKAEACEQNDRGPNRPRTGTRSRERHPNLLSVSEFLNPFRHGV